MSVYSAILSVHAAVGVVALAAFWSAAFLRKGSPLHRRAGQAFLLAMAGILATGVPMAAHQALQGRTVTATFLAYLLVITATGVWQAWRAIRDRHDIARYTGPAYVAFAVLSLLSGVTVLAIGLRQGAPLLMGFSGIGLFAGIDMLRKRHRRAALAAQPRWWMVEHYTAMAGNGIATHIAFLSIGLPRLLPGLDGTALHYTAWFGPVLVAIVAKVLLDRNYRAPRSSRTAPVATRPVLQR